MGAMSAGGVGATELLGIGGMVPYAAPAAGSGSGAGLLSSGLRQGMSDMALAGQAGNLFRGGGNTPGPQLQPPGLPGVPTRPGGFQPTSVNPMQALAQQIAQRRQGLQQMRFA
ncbi:MAG TPA: hypothetical protein DCQ64_01420 [Candidatus Rokubacteria bacterium]|nr:hypothetical protein [Candidatus Rokubacteria bacterium]